MRWLRILCAALLLLASALAVPLHAATAHGMVHLGAATAQISAAHIQHHGNGKCCPDHHKGNAGALCQLACSATVAVLDARQHLDGTRAAHAVQFASGPPAWSDAATVAPDPFPPKPSRIA